MLEKEVILGNIINVIKKYRKILIFIKGSPDPDVIASSYAFKIISDIFKVTVDIIAEKQISLLKNKQLVNLINIPIKIYNNSINLNKYDGYIILDFPSVLINEIKSFIPCIIHIDHHSPKHEDIDVEYKLISDEIGSVSTLMVQLIHILREKIDTKIVNKVNTALFYGIMTDTDDLKNSTDEDIISVDIIKSNYNEILYKKIYNTGFSKKTNEIMEFGKNNFILYKDWIICSVGFVSEKNRDSISILSDYLLEKNLNSEVVVVYAIVESDKKLYLDASFRTRSRNIDLNLLIKKITENGGARKFKGALQIHLDFFHGITERNKFKEIIDNVVIDKLKYLKDNYHNSGFISKIKLFLNNFILKFY